MNRPWYPLLNSEPNTLWGRVREEEEGGGEEKAEEVRERFEETAQASHQAIREPVQVRNGGGRTPAPQSRRTHSGGRGEGERSQSQKHAKPQGHQHYQRKEQRTEGEGSPQRKIVGKEDRIIPQEARYPYVDSEVIQDLTKKRQQDLIN